jgi:hypothetical protein
MGFLISSPLWGNLLFALFIMPFTLMIIRVIIAFRDVRKRKQIIHGWVLYAIPSIAFLALTAYTIFVKPFTEENPQRIYVYETIDTELQERKLSFRSEAPLGSIDFTGSDLYENIRADRARSIVEYAEYIPRFVEAEKVERRFLDRKYVTLTIKTEGDPVNIEFLLFAEGTILIYDSNFPFSQNPEEGAAVVHVGAYPPDPLELELVLPGELEFDAKITVYYQTYPYELSISSENAVIEKQLTYTTWLGL